MSSSVLQPPAAPLPNAAVASPPPLPVEQRIGVLDVLRGIALLGMFMVHFHDYSVEAATASGAGAPRSIPWIDAAMSLFFDTRFYTMFAILFGVGFALQLRRADARGERFTARFVRRLAALAVFGLIAEGVFGYNVLLSYALWGLPLLLVRRWPVRALVVLLLVCAASRPIRNVAQLTIKGRDRFVAESQANNAAFRAAVARHDTSEAARDWGTAISGRFQYMPTFYRQFEVLPAGSFTLFLIGLIGFRLGLFDRPEAHRRMIVALMAVGCVSWALATWVFPIGGPAPPPRALPNGISPIAFVGLIARSNAFTLLRESWLAFTYIGAVLLLVAYNRAWLDRLAPFAWTGRMALTNYMLQVIVLDTLFSKHGADLMAAPVLVPVYALALFGTQALFSRWWLARYRLGPLEWVWRSATYLKLQPQRISAPVAGVVAAAA